MAQTRNYERVISEFRKNFGKYDARNKADLMNLVFGMTDEEYRIFDLSDTDDTIDLCQVNRWSFKRLFEVVRDCISNCDSDYENLNCNGSFPSDFIFMKKNCYGEYEFQAWAFFENDSLYEQYEDTIVEELVKRPYYYGEHYKLIGNVMSDLVFGHDFGPLG